MMLHELVRELDQRDIHLYVQDGKLRCKAPPDALTPEIQSALALRKMEIITQLTRGQHDVPPNRIPPRCEALSPEMLPLVALTQAEIDRIVVQVPGGAGNVQDLYPLAPLQEGILFHHLMATEGDAYLLPLLLAFDTRERLEGFLGAMQSVIDRHDILRTAVLWEGLPEPVQVVWREAPMVVEEVTLAPGAVDVAEQLRARFDPRHYRLDVREAPLLRGFIARNAVQGRWLLLLLSHHLAIDHTTLEILVDEIRAHVGGEAHRLPPPLPFRNFVAQARLGVSRDEHEAFFRAMLGKVNEPTAPFGLLDVQGDGSGIEEASLELEVEVARRLRARARALRVSAASLCHLAFAQVLGRLSGREDVVFGTVLFGRMQGGAGADRVLGMFINTLPVRITLDEEGVEEAVRGTHTLLAGLLRHEHASLALAQRCSAVPAPAPLFSALFNYRYSLEDAQADSPEAAWDGIEMLHSEERTNYPLTLSVDDLGEGFRLTAQVQRPIAPERLCGYMQTALVHLVAALETAPHTVVRTLEVLPEPERHQLLDEWNATRTDYPKDRCIHQLFEAQVERSPDATAVVYEDQSLRYRELNSKANQLAHHLRGLGVGPDTLVGICVERSLEMVIGLLGILKAGGAYLPLDPEYPKERLAYMLADARPSVLLTQARLREVLPAHPEVFCLDTDWPSIARRSKKNLSNYTSPLNLPYVIYTSGSTGRPKGAQVAHSSLINFLSDMTHRLALGSHDVLLAVTSLSFDIAGLELFSPIIVGGRSILAGQEDVRDPVQLGISIGRSNATVMQATPSAWRRLVMSDWRADGSLRILCGGEPLSRDLATQLLNGETEFWNLYGPTETTVWSTVSAITSVDGAPPIGRPIANTQTYLLDPALEPVPIGVCGELFIGGAGLARGYLNRPELTAERFVPDPFGAEPGERLYRTGDVARYRPDGNLEYLGRMDHQVKVRGFRIELGEIEAKLAEHPQVEEAVVLAREDIPGEKRLVGYVVGKDQEAVPAIDELRAHLQRVLPEYMVPGAFVFLEALPLTPNGKVDRKALPAPDLEAQLAHQYVAPRNSTEEILANIWAEVLGVERVGIHDNFFEMGGDSILSIQVVARAKAAGLDMTPRRLFQHQSVAALAAIIPTASDPEGDEQDDLGDPAMDLGGNSRFPLADLDEDQIDAVLARYPDVEDIYPPTPLQEGILFHTALNPGTGVYLMQHRYLIEGDFDVDTFQRAWQLTVDEYTILRTCFTWEVGIRPHQVVHRGIRVRFTHLDWRERPKTEQYRSLDALLERELVDGFDLMQPSPMHVRFVDLGDERHYFVFSFHHILLDDWSVSLVLARVLENYELLISKFSNSLLQGPTPRPYKDYIAWLQRHKPRGVEAFWRDYLGGFYEPTPLVPGHLLKEAEQHGVADHILLLSEEDTHTLTNLARQHRVTPNTFIQAAWALTIAHYSSRSDIVFGVTVAGRPTDLRGCQSAVGLFINAVALRVRIDPRCRAIPWAQAIFDGNLQLREYEHTPLVEVQGWSEIQRGTALFQSLLTFENAPVATALKHIKFNVIGEGRVHTNYPLTLMVVPGQSYHLQLTYDRGLFDSNTVAAMLGHFKNLLEGMVRNPEARIGELPMLSESDRHQLLRAWNATVHAYAEPRDLVGRFETRVEQTPEACAVTCGDARLTYGELNARANRVARGLSQLGVGPDGLVALLDDRGVDFLVMMLGIFKAGGAYVPLDPVHPDGRMVQVLEESGVRLMLCGDTHRARAEGVMKSAAVSSPSLVSLAELEAQEEAFPNPPRRHTEQNLAFVIYTSGSTGKPKGAMVEHRGMFNNLITKVPALGLTSTDVIAQTASQCFDISVWQFLTALVIGARVEVFPDDISRDPARLLEQLAARGVTVLETVPSMIRALLEIAEGGTKLPALRWLMPCGEAFPPELCRRWMHRFPDLKLLNAYGPAECSDDVSYHPIELPGEGDLTVPIGRPVHNTRLYLLNHWLEPVPVGVPGEICVGGVQVGRGYLNRADLTAAAFIPDPVGEAGERLYRTGDLGRYRSDGVLEFLGRIDHQVKIRGHRIEPGEIEACLVTDPEVREACVVPREVSEGVYRLVAYVVGAVQEVGGLRAHILKTLPEYMVPAAFVFLEALPRTPNGKVDRKRLPDPDIEAQLAHQYVAPRNPTEEILADIWAEVLGVERVGIHDNFFELGGHSLFATQVVSRVRRSFAIELPLRALFESPSVGALGLVVEAAQREAGGVSLPPLMPVPRKDALPLSHAQQRLWFLDQLDPGGAVYHIPGALRLVGDLDIEAFERGIHEIVRRHEVLRTTFAMVEGRGVQVIAPELELSVPVLDLSRVPREHREAEVRRLASEEAQRPFDLAVGPLLRVGLLDLGDDAETGLPAHVVLFTLHHIVSDGWSMDVLVREFVALYEAFSQGRPSPLPELPIQYADFAVWQRKWLQGEILERQLSYWKEQLSGAPEVLTLPTDRPRPAVQSYRGASDAFSVSKTLTEALHGLSRREGVTLFMTLLAAFQVLLSRYSGQRDICVGSPIANRNRVEIEGLIGFFVNTLVLRTDLSGNPSFIELLTRVREVCLGAQAHQDLPFEKLVEERQPVRDMSHSPLFQVMFVFQNAPSREAELPGLHISGVEAETETAKLDLTLAMTEEPGGLQGSIEYATDLFEPVAIARLAEHFQVLLEGIAARPGSHLSELPMLTEPERHQLLDEWNATEAEYPKDKCIHQLFEAQVERSPDATAVVYEDQSLRYRELNAKANQLAHHLRGLGVGPDTLVGICVERSLEMVIGLLGILKAGGVYLPLDPEYPKERLAYMLEDAQPSVLLTQARLREVLPAHPTIFCLDADWSSIARRSKKDLSNYTSPLNLAYVIYTSGSTGKPKGVGVTHQNVRRLFLATEREYGFDASDVWTLFHSYAFDFSVWELWGALLYGGRVVVVPHWVSRSPEALHQLLKEHRVTVLNQTPSSFYQLDTVDAELAEPLSLRLVIFGGEALEPRRLGGWFERHGDGQSRLINMYGITETTVHVTLRSLESEDTEGATGSVIGRPLPDLQAYLLDVQGHPVPIGVPGELYVGGSGLARGYLNRPELTAERFVPNPFGAEPGERLYRTGDVARYRPDGNLEYLGRMDHQVKVRGFRIELGEIEAKLTEHPQVKEAVVLAREDTPGEKRLVGYVVGQDPEAVPAMEELRAHLRRVLPDYMVPGAFVYLEALPLTPNGKVDRKALPAPDVSAQLAHRYVAPRTPTEWMLANQVAAVVGVDRVGMHDNFFFHLGGHSLLALQLMQRVRSTVDSILPLTAIFQAPTVALLAEWIAANIDKMKSPLVTMRSGERYRPLFCIHPGGHGVIKYQSLANAQDEGRAVYGIQSRALFDSTLRADSIEEMAADYARLIQEHCPTGPYNLLGWSMGGMIALAVAAHVERRGATVSFLGILDTAWSSNNEPEHDATVLDYFRGFCDLHDPNPFEKLSDPERRYLLELSAELSPEDRYIRAAMWGQERGYWSDASVELMRFLYADEQH